MGLRGYLMVLTPLMLSGSVGIRTSNRGVLEGKKWRLLKLLYNETGWTWGFVDVVWQIVKSALVFPNLLEKVAAICWGIWKNRCEVWHGGHRRSSSDIAHRSLVFLEEFQVATSPLQYWCEHTTGQNFNLFPIVSE
ncbi:hypothetical protein CFP56_007068 [Quercus suber]|uniref:Uncharacterized protein n=1 Tax=Quercus suber TaxID=58331 RepID=A0AAW0IEP9_QUESU